MSIPKTIIADIRERVDLTELIGRTVRLKSQGGSMVGLCPFHQEKTPSFHVNNTKKFYYCFGCQAKGDCYSFLMEQEGLSFVEAVKELGDAVGVKVEDREMTREEKLKIERKTTLKDVNKAASDWFHEQLLVSPDAKLARSTLKRRGIKEETIRRSRLGFAPDSYDAFINAMHQKGYREELLVRAALAKRGRSNNAYAAFRNRIMFPIFNKNGNPIAFGGRALSDDDPAKYLNSSSYELYDKSKVLYGLNWAQKAINRKSRVLLVEGYFDVLSLHQAGFEEAVASCGTALRASHLGDIKRLAENAYALFDGDEAGMSAAEKSLDVFLEVGLQAYYLKLPEGQDPDDFIQDKGAEAFQEALGRSISLGDFVLQRTALRHGSGAQGQKNALTELLPMLRKVDGILQANLILRCSNLLQMPEESIRQALGRPLPQMGPAPAAGAPPSSTWRSSKHLNQLIWLLIHEHSEAAPQFADLDLEMLTEHAEAQQVVGRLINGEPVVELITSCENQHLANVISAASTKEGVFASEKASHATLQLISILERDAVNAKIRHLHLRISQLHQEKDSDTMFDLIQERAVLQKRLAKLNQIIHTSSLGEAVKP